MRAPSSRYLLAIIAVAATIAGTSPALAADSACDPEIAVLPCTIRTPGHYELARAAEEILLPRPDSHKRAVLTIDSPDVTVDLRSNRIVQLQEQPGDFPYGFGIEVTKRSRGAVVTGCNAQLSGFSIGMAVFGDGTLVGLASNCKAKNAIGATHSVVGFEVEADGTTLRNLDANENSIGIQLDRAKNNRLEKVTVNRNHAWGIGIQGSDGNALSDLTTNSNGMGIAVVPDPSGNTRYADGRVEEFIGPSSHGNRISDGIVSDNSHEGIMIGERTFDTQVSRVEASGNGGTDMADFNSDCGTDSWTGNTFTTRNMDCIH